MGAGKTQSAITRMNEDTNGKYIFVTPYLKEVERIKESCAVRDFLSPENTGQGKLDGLHTLLIRRKNIVSTHALFSTYTPYTAELIHDGDYTLILDEVFCVVEPVNITRNDFDILISSDQIEIEEDGEHVRWLDQNYDGTRFQDIMQKALSHTLILYKNMLLFWTFPVDIFKAFQEVIILTYMFDAQFQKYYFQMCSIETERVGSKMIDGVYRFCPASEMPKTIPWLKNKISIVDDVRLNRIGDRDYSLSSSWYKREYRKEDRPLLDTLRKNLINFFKNKCNANSSDTMWTTFKTYKGALQGKGYTKGFLSYNIRATNEYRSRSCLAYCVNAYFNPYFKQYFFDHGCTVDEDKYALSEMIQWIWRSAIRDGKEITVYVPSKRMRELLVKWIDDMC